MARVQLTKQDTDSDQRLQFSLTSVRDLRLSARSSRAGSACSRDRPALTNRPTEQILPGDNAEAAGSRGLPRSLWNLPIESRTHSLDNVCVAMLEFSGFERLQLPEFTFAVFVRAKCLNAKTSTGFPF